MKPNKPHVISLMKYFSPSHRNHLHTHSNKCNLLFNMSFFTKRNCLTAALVNSYNIQTYTPIYKNVFTCISSSNFNIHFERTRDRGRYLGDRPRQTESVLWRCSLCSFTLVLLLFETDVRLVRVEGGKKCIATADGFYVDRTR